MDNGRGWTIYGFLLVAATVLWLVYSMWDGRDTRLVVVLGIALLALIVPLIRRPTSRK